MRPIGSAAELENCRHQGLRLLEQGYSVSQVGQMLGCGHSMVSKWRKTYKKGCEEGIQTIPNSGRKHRLAKEELPKLAKYLKAG